MRRLLVLFTALLAAAPAPAAVFPVNSTVDAVDANPGNRMCADASGRCTLRAAVQEANVLDGDDDVQLPAGRFVLTLGSLIVKLGDWASPQALRLHGSGAAATIIDAAGSGRVIAAGGSVNPESSLELQGLTITGGRVAPSDLVGGGGVLSAGVHSLTIRDSVIAGNAAQHGAGISFWAGLWLLLERVTVSQNQGDHSALLIGQASDGGPFGAFAIVNSTISDNTTEDGPTIYGISGNGVIANSTVADNRRGSGGSEAFAITGGHLVLSGSIVSNRELEADCDLIFGSVSGGYNIDSDGSCNLTDPTDLPNTDPLLGPLQNHGGPTRTHALLPGSPALNAIPVADCTYDDDGDPGTPEVPLATDQRGAARPQGAGCDIGAFEQSVCGLGAELALVLPTLWLRRRSSRC